MKTKDELTAEISQVDMELRELHDAVRDTSRAVNLARAREKALALEERKRSLQGALSRFAAECARPERRAHSMRSLVTAEALLRSARERRSIVIGDAGAINQIRQLFKEISETDNILNLATYYYGPNASTNIPVLSTLDEPADYVEGTDSVAADASAGITVTEIQPKAHASVLPITAEMLQMGAVDIEAQVADIFSQAFRSAMHRGMLTGDGRDKRMKGLFTSAAENTGGQTAAAGSAITITELSRLALALSSKDESYRIIMNPSVYQGVLSDATDSEDIKIYKEGLIRDKTIEGVEVLLDAYAPAGTGSGNVLAVAAPLHRYAIGIAGELMIKPIDVMGDTKTYYQAIMFFSARQVSDSDVYSITAA